jgi:drug/metabolite transporter (DMT)-like permease
VSFAGVALIGMQGQFVNPSFNVGDLCALASMVLWASYTVFLRLRRDALDMVEFLTLVCLLGLVFMTPWLIAEGFTGMTLQLNAAGAAAVLYSAIGSLLLAYAGWSYVVTRLGAARAGVTMHLMPAISVVLAAAFLGERPYWYHFAGVALILSGVALASARARVPA